MDINLLGLKYLKVMATQPEGYRQTNRRTFSFSLKGNSCKIILNPHTKTVRKYEKRVMPSAYAVKTAAKCWKKLSEPFAE